MKLLKILITTILLLLFTGCAASRISYYNNLTSLTTHKSYDKAEHLITKNTKKFYSKKNTLLYYLDKGYIFHVSGNYKKSNKMFDKARKQIEYLFTKSASKEILSLLTNDKAKPYRGDNFEKAFIYFFSLLNYISLDNLESSLVEVRALNHFLTVLQTNYGNKDVYKEDAFLRYITGLLYENDNEINDAFISYRKALYTYRNQNKYFNVAIPQDLFNSTIDTAYKMGFNDLAQQTQKDFPNLYKNYKKTKSNDTGELIVLHYTGLIPHKISVNIEMAFGKAWAHVDMVEQTDEETADYNAAKKTVHAIASDEQIVIAFPKIKPTKYLITNSTIEIDGKIYNTQVVEDLGNIATQTFKDKTGKTTIRTIARAAIKHALSKNLEGKVDEKANSTFGFILKSIIKIGKALTEEADTRSWQLLPDKIRMSRIKLPQGTYSLTSNYYTQSHNFVDHEIIEDINIKKNKKTFIVLHSR